MFCTKSSAVLFLLALSLTGCTVQVNLPESNSGGNSENTSQEAGDVSSDAFAEYQAQIVPLAVEEESLIARYDSVSGDNYTDDLTMYTELVDMVPDVRSFITQIEAIMPSDPELARLHEIYVDAWNSQYAGFTMIIDALEKQDYGIMTEANELLAEGRSLMREYIDGVSELAN